jgi:hypothetical protein|eukprot:jgi/Chrpa1/1918/Chrysochromulina_OHIO_Genome00018992-RA
MTLITFSYKQTSGAGGNPLVARVKTGLERQGIKVEMRHGSANGKFVHVDCTQAKGTHSANYQEWFLYWKDMAETSDLVVLFDSEDQGYFQSDGCQMEERYAKAHCKYCSMGKYIDQGEDAEQIAERIFNKLK